jgi:hypothetical protein
VVKPCLHAHTAMHWLDMPDDNKPADKQFMVVMRSIKLPDWMFRPVPAFGE